MGRVKGSKRALEEEESYCQQEVGKGSKLVWEEVWDVSSGSKRCSWAEWKAAREEVWEVDRGTERNVGGVTKNYTSINLVSFI